MSTPLTVELLQELENRLHVMGAPIVDLLRDGATDRALRDLEHELGLQLPTEAITWWRWHDGSNHPAGPRWSADHIGPGFELMSTAEALAQFRVSREIAQKASSADRPADWWWAPEWVPIIHRSAGWIVVECGSESRTVTPLRVIEPATFDTDAFRYPVCDSLGELIDSWIDAIDRGAWLLSDDRWEWQGSDDDLRHSRGLI